jgi:uncharacterized alkaline shock family protein YloU
MSTDEQPPGDVPVTPEGMTAASRPVMAEDVVATYVAAAVRSTPGVTELHGRPWQELSERVHMGAARKGIAIKEVKPGCVEVDVHVSVAWDTIIPEMARTLQETVAHNIETLLDMDVCKTTVFVDEVEAPPELK